MAELLIEGVKVPVAKDIPMSLNYLIADIREPENRDSNFSKTLVVHGDDRVNRLFTQIFDANVAVQTTGTTNLNPDFNPSLKVDASLIEQDMEQFRGKLRMLNINLISINDEHRIEYELAIQGNLGDIFTDIGDGKLEDLDLSEFDHVYNRDNQINSWDTSIVQNGSPVSFALGTGYVYPTIDYGNTDGTYFGAEFIYPAIYVKQYIDKIFSDIGWSFTSTFFDSDLFKRLIISFAGEVFSIDNTNAISRLFRAGKGISAGASGLNVFSTLLIQAGGLFNDDSTGDNFDNSGVFASGNYTVNKNGLYRIDVDLPIFYKFFPDQAGALGNGRITQFLSIFRTRGGTKTIIAFTTDSVADIHSALISQNSEGFDKRLRTTVNNIFLASGDVISLELVISHVSPRFPATSAGDVFFRDTNNNPVTGGIQVSLPTSRGGVTARFQNFVANPRYVAGDTIEMNTAIPKEIKQRDFLVSIFRMFNLYITQDPDNEKKLLIETRDTFYDGGGTQNWEKKIDTKQIKSAPMGELNFKTQLFTYAKDEDFFNKKYNERWGEIYGQKINEITNDFLKSEKKYEVIFGATPLAEIVIPGMVIPRIISSDGGAVKPTKSKIRILRYEGVKTADKSYGYRERLSATLNLNRYAFAGHIDDVDSPTVDISFGVPREVFYNAQNYTNNNLFNVYHKKFFEEITSPDNRIVTVFVDLKPRDILTFDFRDKFFFNKRFHRINKIDGYDPSNDELTKCEFVRLIEGTAFIPQLKITSGAVDTFNDGDFVPLKSGIELNNSNISPISMI